MRLEHFMLSKARNWVVNHLKLTLERFACFNCTAFTNDTLMKECDDPDLFGKTEEWDHYEGFKECNSNRSLRSRSRSRSRSVDRKDSQEHTGHRSKSRNKSQSRSQSR